MECKIVYICTVRNLHSSLHCLSIFVTDIFYSGIIEVVLDSSSTKLGFEGQNYSVFLT